MALTEQDLTLALTHIAAGLPIGLPTETVYGLAANALDVQAVGRIFMLKGRPADHPLIVHVAVGDELGDWATAVPEGARELMRVFWPGPLTLILNKTERVPGAVTGGQASVGLRCPDHPVAQTVLARCGVPLAAPSANRFGRVSPTTAAHVRDEFGDQVQVLDGGPCARGIESTIIDWSRGVPVLLRPGAITRKQVQAHAGVPVLSPVEALAFLGLAPKASGTLAAHYQPDARVDLVSRAELALMEVSDCGVASTALLRLSSAVTLRGAVPITVSTDPERYAQRLYALLRELDQQGYTRIVVEAPPDDAAWDGVRDRLMRATFK